MTFVPTTKVTLLEVATKKDQWGDDIDVYKAGRLSMPAHISEVRQTVFDPSDSRLTTVRQYRAMVPPGSKVQKGSRLKDEGTGIVYSVQDVEQRKSFVRTMPLVLDLQLVE